jgi:hypothetical protein
MCTVTFIPARDTFFLTSNRDEKNWRSDAHPPGIYTHPSGKMLYPKDGDAGGTWIAAHENGNAVVFLNGGFEAHVPQPPYRKSRGLILLDMLDHSTPFNCFLAINLNKIEPFTAIVIDNRQLFDCRWDGHKKHFTETDMQQPHIWSSATLYPGPVREKRKNWFTDWIAAQTAPSQDDILHFHQFTGDGDEKNDLRMNREGQVYTVSVTSLRMDNAGTTMEYLDLKNNQRHSAQLLFENSIADR